MAAVEAVKSCPDREQAVELALAAAKLYPADFLPESNGEGWCMGLAPRYRGAYMDLCCNAAEWLTAAGRYQEAASLCADVIALEPVDEDFSILYMHALTLGGQPKKALEYYGDYTKKLEADFGVSPTAQLEAERLLAVEKQSGGVEREQVVDFLKTRSAQDGAFQCDSNVFREIVNRHLRDMRRSGTPAQILVFRLESTGVDGETRAIYMRQMEETLLHSLRGGDPFTRGGMELLLALLPGAAEENGPSITERIMNRFHRDYPQSGAQFDIQVLDLGTMGKTWEEKGRG